MFLKFWSREEKEVRRIDPNLGVIWLAGERLKGLVGCQFWLGEELVDAFSAVYIKTDKSTHRFFWDDHPELWKMEEKDEFPEVEQVPFDLALGDEHLRFPVNDLAEIYGLYDQQIHSFTLWQDPRGGVDVAILKLASGKHLRWSYILRTESTSLEVLDPGGETRSDL